MALPAFRVANTISGGHPRVSYWTVPASPANAWIAGEAVYMTGTGDEIDRCTDSITDFLGIAKDGSAGNEGELIPVVEATPDVIFSAEHKGTYAATNLGAQAGIDAAGTLTVVELAEAVKVFSVRGLDPTDDDSSGTRRVLVSVLASASHAAGGDDDVV